METTVTIKTKNRMNLFKNNKYNEYYWIQDIQMYYYEFAFNPQSFSTCLLSQADTVYESSSISLYSYNKSITDDMINNLFDYIEHYTAAEDFELFEKIRFIVLSDYIEKDFEITVCYKKDEING